ncbi:DUF2442 domain-containing protein [Pseudomonas sp. NPDC088368]|jgi:hypothetical protein|uniref:DUF2442 domain-containing protein n=1 Tax=Pseudomonas sp. NPDC088368 TaxID=3364453 RepID=UPI003808EBA9
MKRPRLKAVEALADRRLALTFINDQRFVLDLSADVRNYPGLKPLQNATAFMQAQIGDDGWTVEWPDPDIQLGADTLYLDAQAQAATDENTRIFIGWRARTGLPLALAAEALGVSTRSITRYSNGRESAPRTLALACLGWDALQSQGQSGVLVAEKRPAYGVEPDKESE